MANESLPRNVVFFGEAGVGKTSVISMIAGPGVANTDKNYHDVQIDGRLFRLWDTPSDKGSTGWGDNAVVNLCRIIQTMEGVVSLFVYCVRGPRIKDTTAENYQIFHSMFFRSEVPIVLVVTGLEEEEPMDEWWQTNKVTFQKHKMAFAGYACVTATKGKMKEGQYIYQEEYTESTKRLQKLIADPNLNNPKAATSPMAVIKNLRRSATSVLKPKPKQSEAFDVEADDKRNQAKDEVRSNQLEGRSDQTTDAETKSDGEVAKKSKMQNFRGQAAHVFTGKQKPKQSGPKGSAQRNVDAAKGNGAVTKESENAVDDMGDGSGEVVNKEGACSSAGSTKSNKIKAFGKSATGVFKSKSKQGERENKPKKRQAGGQSKSAGKSDRKVQVTSNDRSESEVVKDEGEIETGVGPKTSHPDHCDISEE